MGFSKVKMAAAATADFVAATRNPNQFLILMMFFLHAFIPIHRILSIYVCITLYYAYSFHSAVQK